MCTGKEGTTRRETDGRADNIYWNADEPPYARLMITFRNRDDNSNNNNVRDKRRIKRRDKIGTLGKNESAVNEIKASYIY